MQRDCDHRGAASPFVRPSVESQVIAKVHVQQP